MSSSSLSWSSGRLSLPAMVALVGLVVAIILATAPGAEACLCHVIPNFQCPPPPRCCESGQYARDECGCCLECAKAEFQPCGGPSGSSGKCASGLQCLKTCASCSTIGSNPEPCIFPFVYDGVEYNECIGIDARSHGIVWCATEVHPEFNNTVVDGRWGDCADGCPGARNGCNDRRFDIIVGQCINARVPGAIPNWRGAPTFRLLGETQNLVPAPKCRNSGNSEGRRSRLYVNTCRCAQGQDAFEISGDGKLRGNCTGVDNDAMDGVSPIWCFLENVRDPANPTSGCYSDVTWSSTDGRFWSAEACNGLPPTQPSDLEQVGQEIKAGRPQNSDLENIRNAFETLTRLDQPDSAFDFDSEDPPVLPFPRGLGANEQASVDLDYPVEAAEDSPSEPQEDVTEGAGGLRDSVHRVKGKNIGLGFFEEKVRSSRVDPPPQQSFSFNAVTKIRQKANDLNLEDDPDPFVRLPIINQREDGVEVMPTPAPDRRRSSLAPEATFLTPPIEFINDPPPFTVDSADLSVIGDPPPLTTSRVNRPGDPTTPLPEAFGARIQELKRGTEVLTVAETANVVLVEPLTILENHSDVAAGLTVASSRLNLTKPQGSLPRRRTLTDRSDSKRLEVTSTTPSTALELTEQTVLDEITTAASKKRRITIRLTTTSSSASTETSTAVSTAAATPAAMSSTVTTTEPTSATTSQSAKKVSSSSKTSRATTTTTPTTTTTTTTSTSSTTEKAAVTSVTSATTESGNDLFGQSVTRMANEATGSERSTPHVRLLNRDSGLGQSGLLGTAIEQNRRRVKEQLLNRQDEGVVVRFTKVANEDLTTPSGEGVTGPGGSPTVDLGVLGTFWLDSIDREKTTEVSSTPN